MSKALEMFGDVKDKVQKAIDADSKFWHHDGEEVIKAASIIKPFDDAIDSIDEFLKVYSAPLERLDGAKILFVKDEETLDRIETVATATKHLCELLNAMADVRNWYARLWNNRFLGVKIDSKAAEAEYDRLRAVMRSLTTKQVPL